MKGSGYILLVRTADLLGPWVFVFFSRLIAAGYFVFSPRRRESSRFYAILYPQQSRLFHLWCAFRQFQNFTTIHFDRFLANQGRVCTFDSTGEEALKASFDRSGTILLMSHLGNWEMAARLLMRQKQQLPLLLYMGVKEKEGVERTQKEELRQAGVTVIGVDQEARSPFAAVEGIRLLRQGGIISMAGDVVWRADQRRIPVSILGHVAYVPEAPFVFALVSGAPIHVFFAFRCGTNRYRFTFSSPITVTAANRAERPGILSQAAQRYADLLQQALMAHPLEWYHFDRFLHTPEEGADGP